jgi:energy-coupling factor transport system substrate-specific component
MVTITGTILGLLMFVTGHPWPVIVSGIVLGFLADIIMKAEHYQSWKNLLLGYIVFSEWIMGALVPLFFMRESYFASIRAGYGDTYADTLLSLTPPWVFYAMILLAVAGGTLGALLGKAVLKNHFKKAGIA